MDSEKLEGKKERPSSPSPRDEKKRERDETLFFEKQIVMNNDVT